MSNRTRVDGLVKRARVAASVMSKKRRQQPYHSRPRPTPASPPPSTGSQFAASPHKGDRLFDKSPLTKCVLVCYLPSRPFLMAPTLSTQIKMQSRRPAARSRRREGGVWIGVAGDGVCLQGSRCVPQVTDQTSVGVQGWSLFKSKPVAIDVRSGCRHASHPTSTASITNHLNRKP